MAFGALLDGYWKPVYKHLRITWRLSPDDAQDLTQGFFAEAFHKQWLERYEPGKARFRTFVRMCADRYVMNERQAAARQKRGGGAALVPLDFIAAEHELSGYGGGAPPDPDAYFQQEFVRALFERAVAGVRLECEQAGKALHFTLFERYDLSPSPGVDYASLAAEFGLTVTQVTNHLARVRRRFREQALDALRALCGSDEEFRTEAREIFGREEP
jgi:DNA-directed RNA polymerase specialized sigma24 family protein